MKSKSDAAASRRSAAHGDFLLNVGRGLAVLGLGVELAKAFPEALPVFGIPAAFLGGIILTDRLLTIDDHPSW